MYTLFAANVAQHQFNVCCILQNERTHIRIPFWSSPGVSLEDVSLTCNGTGGTDITLPLCLMKLVSGENVFREALALPQLPMLVLLKLLQNVVFVGKESGTAGKIVGVVVLQGVLNTTMIDFQSQIGLLSISSRDALLVLRNLSITGFPVGPLVVPTPEVIPWLLASNWMLDVPPPLYPYGPFLLIYGSTLLHPSDFIDLMSTYIEYLDRSSSSLPSKATWLQPFASMTAWPTSDILAVEGPR